MKRKITYVQLLLLHLAMAMVIYVIPSTAKFFLLAAIAYFFFSTISNNNKNEGVLLGAAYIMGFEVFSRMTGGSFSYEFAKYAVIGFLVLGMFYRGFTRNSWPYLIYLGLLVPGILFSAINLNYGSNVGNAIGFNLSGPVCLGISALYCYDRKITHAKLQQVLMAALLPIIAMTAYLYVYTPNIRDSLSGTGSNFITSGGYGPNQVATALGVGMFVLFTRLFIIKNRTTNLIDLALLAFVSYRGIVTFSRGGIITAAGCAIVFLVIFFLRSKKRERAILLPKMSLVFGVVALTWLVTSISTLGLIDKRYSNQDAAGRIKEDISTGRAELIESELQAFYEHPFTGIGIGKIKEYRYERTGRVSATHNEVSRMLSEHGIFGIIALAILVFTPLIFGIKNKSNAYLYPLALFWLLTINHTAMRIAAPALIYGLSLITLVDVKKNPVHRKQIK